jgi:hypothetical protein
MTINEDTRALLARHNQNATVKGRRVLRLSEHHPTAHVGRNLLTQCGQHVDAVKYREAQDGAPVCSRCAIWLSRNHHGGRG